MPRSGAGTYSQPPGTAAVSLGTISSVDFNTLVDDIADALTDSLSKSGNGAATADISMGSHKITNLTAGASAADAVRLDQLTTGYQPLDADLTAIAALDATGGVIVKTAANTYARRTIAGAGAATVTNGDGVAASPTITVAMPTMPGGRLTLTANTPVLATDATAQTTLRYTAFESNYLPIWNGTNWVPTIFAADLTLALDNNSGHTGYHAAKKVFDVFGFDDSGTLRIGTGPDWSLGAVGGAVGNYVSAGALSTSSAARGTGAGSTEIARTNGLYVNVNSIVLRWGSASGNTVTVAAGKATYLGTIWIDATDGQLSCHVAYGQNRKWGVWNAYNRVPITLLAGDTTTAWTYATATWRAARAQTANAITVLCGLAEEAVDSEYACWLQTNTSNALNGVGFNSTSATPGGRWGTIGYAGGALGSSVIGNIVAQLAVAPFIGLNALIALENGNGSNASTVWSSSAGGQTANQLRAVWRG